MLGRQLFTPGLNEAEKYWICYITGFYPLSLDSDEETGWLHVTIVAVVWSIYIYIYIYVHMCFYLAMYVYIYIEYIHTRLCKGNRSNIGFLDTFGVTEREWYLMSGPLAALVCYFPLDFCWKLGLQHAFLAKVQPKFSTQHLGPQVFSFGAFYIFSHVVLE